MAVTGSNTPTGSRANSPTVGTGNSPPPSPGASSGRATPPPTPPAYQPTFHPAGQLPAPDGDIAKAIDATTKDVQRERADALISFLIQPGADLRELNAEDSHVFVALMSVPKTHMVRVVYAPAIGTGGIGRQSAIAGKFIMLHGEGNQLMGPPSVMVVPTSVKTATPTADPTDAKVEQVFSSGSHTVYDSVGSARDQTTLSNIMKFAPIPAYLVYDGFNEDIPAALVYERLRECQHQGLWLDHALKFLRACLIGNHRMNDPKPYVDVSFFRDSPHREAKLWAAKKFKILFPHLAPGGTLNPSLQPSTPVQVQHPQGSTGSVVNLDATALRALLHVGGRGNSTGSEEKKDGDSSFKVSEHEKEIMRKMCGLPAGSEAFPHWFKAIHEPNVSDTDKCNIIAKVIRTAFIYEDAEVPLYAELLKMVRTRNWTAMDMGLIASFENAAKGLSPFGMIDFTLEDIAVMGSDAQDLAGATHVTASDLKAARKKIKAQVPKDGTELLLMLKRYANFIFAIFTSESPLYKELAIIIRAFKKITTNARINVPHNVRATIPWIILLQSRVFAEGEMTSRADMDGTEGCLGEFVNLKNAITAKCLSGLSHDDMPDQLRIDPTRGMKNLGPGKRDLAAMLQAAGSPEDEHPAKTPKQQGGPKRNGFNKAMDALLSDALKKAGDPTLHDVCKFCGVTRENLLPDFNCYEDCLQFCLTGKCPYGQKCKYNHIFASKKQLNAVQTKLKRFLDNPEELKVPGKTPKE